MVSIIPAGRLGNAFFQIGAGVAYAKRHGLEFSAPRFTTHPFWSPLYLQHLQNPNFNPHLQEIRVIEKHFHYEKIPFDESWRDKNIVLQGYWQSEKYMLDFKDEVVAAFGIPHEPRYDVCSIHVRYGDFLIYTDKHVVIDEEYLLKAMGLIKAKTGITRFKVFSDDIPMFKDKLGHLYDFEYSTNNDIMQDLVEMSWSHSFISSSSTFGWWGAWIGRHPEKVVITPEHWFQKVGWQDADTKDIIPAGWIKL